VGDGRLTITTGPEGTNNKINFIDIYPAVARPIVVGTQPVGQTVEENRQVTFSIALSDGSSPFYYEWYRNGSPIAGSGSYTESTTGSFSIRYPQAADAGDYTVVVTNFAGKVTSSVAALTVFEDTTAPAMTSVASLDGRSIGICFSEEMSNSNKLPGRCVHLQHQDGWRRSRWTFAPLGEDSARQPEACNSPWPKSSRENFGSVSPPTLWMSPATASSLDNPRPMSSAVYGGDVGGPGMAGSHFTCDNETIEIVGGGADIWDTADHGYFATKPMQGDFDASVRVVDLKGNQRHNQGGVGGSRG
jgi:hypothetical protein